MPRFIVFYPTRHRYDARVFFSKESAVLHADGRAACFAVHEINAAFEPISHAAAEYLRCPRLDGECAKSCRYKKPFRGGFAQGALGGENGSPSQ